MILRAVAALAILFVTSAAQADGVFDKLVTPADKIRLKNYGESRRVAIAEARSGGTRQEIAILESILAKPVQSFKGFDMTGNWQCRTIKLGGLSPIIVYGWFKCRVTDDGSGWKLDKLTGSQKTTGRFYDESDKRLHYLGSQYVNDDKPKPYGSGPETDQVGYAFRSGPKEWRIELPAPFYESKLDILEFKK